MIVAWPLLPYFCLGLVPVANADQKANGTLHLDVCQSSPCVNGGTCELTGENKTSFKCLCPGQFVGATCQKSAASCVPNPCPPKNHCFAISHEIECVPYNIRGVLIPCSHNLCHGNGDCYLVRGIPQCICHHTYHGTFCENPLQSNNALFRQSNDGGSFYIGVLSLAAAFMLMSVILLVCNVHTWSCRVVMPRRNYDRWKDSPDEIQMQTAEERSRIKSQTTGLYTLDMDSRLIGQSTSSAPLYDPNFISHERDLLVSNA